jgi:sulfite reductase beta subunit-like hemoprotein
MKRKRATAERYVRLTYGMMQSQAWRSLDGNARAIYVELAMLYFGAGTNNGRIGFSVRQAAQTIHVSKDTAARAMSHLQERGFIVATTKGRFVRKRHATRWRLTEFECDLTGQPASRDFKTWTTANILPLRHGGESAERGTDG